MKKLVVIGMILLMGSTAWAADTPIKKAAKEITCDVNGVQQKVKTVVACKALNGTVVIAPAAKKWS